MASLLCLSLRPRPSSVQRYARHRTSHGSMSECSKPVANPCSSNGHRMRGKPSRGGREGRGGRGGRRGRRGRRPQYSPFSPCGYFIAGHCKFRKNNNCQKIHDAEYGMAIRRQWLDPDNEIHKEALQQLAVQKFGSQKVMEENLFPRCFAATLSAHNKLPQNKGEDNETFDYLLVMDLEGKDEIIEFPFLVIDVSARRECGRFQEYIRPKQLFQNLPIDPSSPAIPFPKALEKLDLFLTNDTPFRKGLSSFPLSAEEENQSPRIAVLTCGDWDCRHIHSQCQLWDVETPALFTRWINIKLTFADFYNCPGKVRGMKSMLARLGLLNERGEPEYGFHHIGMFDVENIARCAFHLLDAGAQFKINGRSRS